MSQSYGKRGLATSVRPNLSPVLSVMLQRESRLVSEFTVEGSSTAADVCVAFVRLIDLAIEILVI